MAWTSQPFAVPNPNFDGCRMSLDTVTSKAFAVRRPFFNAELEVPPVKAAFGT